MIEQENYSKSPKYVPTHQAEESAGYNFLVGNDK